MKLFFIAMAMSAAFSSVAQSARYDSIWSDPVIEKRINDGIETNRKGSFSITMPAYKGKTEITITQVRNEFQFGTTAFMVNGFKDKQKNTQYEQLFARFFNLAIVPFYWAPLEPEKGKTRYDSGSNYIYRRPPPDEALAFCRRLNITPKGHCLVWNNIKHAVPAWMPTDTALVEQSIADHIREVAARYKDQIKTWDVVNEAMRYQPRTVMPDDYVYKSFAVAKSAFSPQNRLMINEATTEVWGDYQYDYSTYYLMIKELLQRQIPLAGIGIQFHFFSEKLFEETLAGQSMTPKQLFQVLDLYQKFNKPVHISEITIPTLPNNEQGLKQQAVLTRNFYRLWFSHPSVEAIVWWNAVDGTAVLGEDKWNGGFVHNDFTPKPAYEVLDDLINKQWKTNIKTELQGERYDFRGFYGDYTIRIKQGKKTIEKKIQFTRSGAKEASINP